MAEKKAVEKNKSYPQSEEQAERFSLQLVKLIHEDPEIKRLLQEGLQDGQVPIGVLIGGVVAQILTMLFTKLYEQTKGLQVGANFAVQVIRVAVKEVGAIADTLGADSTVQDEQQAAKIAGDTLDESMKKLYDRGMSPETQGGQMQGPPQGVPQGAPPQEPPQGMLQGGM